MDRWNRKELQILLRTIVRHMREGKTRDAAFQKTAEMLGRSKGTVTAKFYNLFKDMSKAEREGLLEAYGRGEISFADLLRRLEGKGPAARRRPRWTLGEEIILFSEVLHALETGRTKQSAFRAAAQRIGRTPAACTMRYMTHMNEAGHPADERAYLRQWLAEHRDESVSTRPDLGAGTAPESALLPADDALRALQERVDRLDRQVQSLAGELAALRAEVATTAFSPRTNASLESTLQDIQGKLIDVQRMLSWRLGSPWMAPAATDGHELQDAGNP